MNQGHWCKGLIILAVISQKVNLFLFARLGSSMGYQASQLLSQGPQPFVYLFKGEAQCLYLGQNFPFLACFWTTCIPAATDKSAKLNHSPVTSGRGVEGGAVITHTPPAPKFFAFQLLIKDENRFGGNSIECLYPRGISCSSNHFPVEYWSFLEASS